MLPGVWFRENLISFLTETINSRMSRDKVLNLLYDFVKSVLIHLFLKPCKAAPETREDLHHLIVVILLAELIMRPTYTFHHVVIYQDPHLEKKYYADSAITTKIPCLP